VIVRPQTARARGSSLAAGMQRSPDATDFRLPNGDGFHLTLHEMDGCYAKLFMLEVRLPC
jgi:hypothetical protein